MHEFGIRQRFELKQPRVFCSSWLLDIFDKPQSNKKTDALNFCKDENGFVDFVSSRIYMFVNLNMCDILFAYKNKFKVFTYIHILIHVFHNIFFWQPSAHTQYRKSNFHSNHHHALPAKQKIFPRTLAPSTGNGWNCREYFGQRLNIRRNTAAWGPPALICWGARHSSWICHWLWIFQRSIWRIY